MYIKGSSSVVNEKIPENKTVNSQPYAPTSHHSTCARNTSLISERILAESDFRINEECDSIDSYKSSCSHEKITVNDFYLLKLIGKGSFGKVFLVSTKSQRCEYYALKALKKAKIIQQNDVQSTKLERDIANLGYINRFITKLFCAFQDNEFIYFVMEFLNGGDLMFHIENSGKFTEPRTKFYAAEILCGLEFLHSEGIVYRDLKLDNILLDSYGHCKISDFGMCRLLRPGELAETFCGTPDYIAPEILRGDMYDFAVDYWSYGIIIYEMLLGKTPFIGQDEEELFQAIKDKEINYPINELSAYSVRLMKALLERDPTKRIGSKQSHYGNIRDHPFFFTIDWLKLEMGAIESPFRPNVITVIDVANFDTNLTKEIPSLSDSRDKLELSNDQEIFKGFSFKNKNFHI